MEIFIERRIYMYKYVSFLNWIFAHWVHQQQKKKKQNELKEFHHAFYRLIHSSLNYFWNNFTKFENW